MSLHYVIDAYNLINHPLFPHSQKKKHSQQTALIDFIRLKRLTGSSKNMVTVVFDGYPPTTDFRCDYSNIEAVFSRDTSADELIKRIIEKSLNPKIIVVVSNDKEIKFHAQAAGASSVSVEDFAGPKEKSRSPVPVKTELNYTQISKINQELKKIWLK